jgi:predicted transposase YdaD
MSYNLPILKSGGEAATIQRALNELRSDERLVELESLLAFFARFVLDSELVSQIMRWDMVVLRESPWYQEILSEGRREEGTSIVLRQLSRRVGTVSEEMKGKVRSLLISQLEALGEALLDFNDTADLEGWMRSQNID